MAAIELNQNITGGPDEQLDLDYNPRLRVPDCSNYFSKWKADALAARNSLSGTLDIAYGESGAETLDFFPAKRSDGPTPLLVFIHGGYWRAMDKSDFSWVATPYVNEGVSVAVINYGLAPKVPISEIVDQVRRACLWLHHNATPLKVDAHHMICSGHSAGGHLSGMMLATDWQALSDGAPTDLFRSVIAISGLFDLLPLSRAPFLRDDIKLDEKMALQLSPAYLAQRNRARLLLAVGELESPAFHLQSALLARHWNEAKDIERIAVAGSDHFSVCDTFGNRASSLFEKSLRLIFQ